MSVEQNKALIHRFIDGFGRGDLSVMDDCFAEAFANYRTDGTVMDRAGYKRFVRSSRRHRTCKLRWMRCSPTASEWPFVSR